MTTEKEIYDKYPALFRQKDLPMNQTCMCWGIECGPGWYRLIDKACEQITWVLLHADEMSPGDATFEFTQIKEKFGTLRLYYVTENINAIEQDIVNSIIHYAESRSAYTCEVCGEYGETNDEGWLSTRCSEHKEICFT